MKRLMGHLILGLILVVPGLLPAAELETATASKRETAREFWLDGAVEAINQTTLSAQTQGQVQEILFDVDDYSYNFV